MNTQTFAPHDFSQRMRKSRSSFPALRLSRTSPEVDAFREGLGDLGYIEGMNINIEYRFANGGVERLPELAAELARLKPEVIVIQNTAASLAAKQATGTIPIVFAGIADGVGAGLVASVARPGGNVTGLASAPN